MQRIVLTKTSLSRHSRMTAEEAAAILAEIRLLSEEEVRRLFPRSRIYRERFLGMTKSFTAHNL